MIRKSVVIGFLGTTLDVGKQLNRWQRWRPSVALCQHEEFPVDRLELIYGQRFAPLAEQLRGDVARVSPETDVRLNAMELKDPWDFVEVYGAMHDFAAAYPFDPDTEDYYVNITTGTHVAQICWFLLIEARYIPAKILQLTPPKQNEHGAKAHCCGGISPDGVPTAKLLCSTRPQTLFLHIPARFARSRLPHG